MPHAERFDVLVLGSGTGGKLLAWLIGGRHQASKKSLCALRDFHFRELPPKNDLIEVAKVGEATLSRQNDLPAQ